MKVFTINDDCEYFGPGSTEDLESTLYLLSELLDTCEAGDLITITVGEMTREQIDTRNASIGTI